MVNFIKNQTSFAHGEVAPEFWEHDDINGLSRLENMDVLAGGGLRRRSGLVSVRRLPGAARLIPFSVAADEEYILAVTGERLLIFRGDTFVQNLLTPWTNDVLDKLQYAQRFDTMIFVHPDWAPVILKKTEHGFVFVPFDFERNDSDMTVSIPFISFDDAAGVTITVEINSAGNNFATFTTNKDFWTPENVNGRLLLLGRQWVVDQYISARQVRVCTNGSSPIPSEPVTQWREAVFSARRGWPCSITFHQDRLVFGGSRSYPGGIWMSQVGHHTNFDIGTGLDDQAIFITLLSQQRQQICTVVSSDNLQILTGTGEWAISNKPLTPSSVDIKQHTTVGSMTSKYIPPQKIEGATVFISGTGRDIRELSLDVLGETYNANDLSALAKHLMRRPLDMSYNPIAHQLYVVMDDGDMAVLNYNSARSISAWARYTTHGRFVAASTIDNQTYVVVCREGVFYLERFSDDALCDCGTHGFSYRVSGLPMRGSGHDAKMLRLRRIQARVMDTKSLFINDMRATLPNHIYDAASPGYTGDVSVNLLGTQRNCTFAPWTISSGEQLPATIMSVTMYGYYLV